jgi:hypothetical protein
MSWRYNSPPNWPAPPAGWAPPEGWRPDPAWGPPPPGWTFWIPAGPAAPSPPPQAVAVTSASPGNWVGRHKVMTAIAIVALVVGGVAAAGAEGSKPAAAPASSKAVATATGSPVPPMTSPTKATPRAVPAATKVKRGTALSALALLAVKGRAPMTG